MNVKWRLTFRIIAWFLLVGFILSVIAGGILYWTYHQLMRIEADRDFGNVGLSRLVDTIRTEGGDLKFDSEMLEIVHRKGGWLQRIDESGHVTDAFYTPPDVPDSYGPGELNAYWMREAPFPYDIYLWIQEKNGVTHTLLYGVKKQADPLLKQLADRGSIAGRTIELPENLGEKLRESGSWLQILDADGDELASSNKPSTGALERFSIQDIALRSFYPDRYGTRQFTQYDQATERTWVLTSPLAGNLPEASPFIDPVSKVLAVGIGLLLLASMLVFTIVSYLFGHSFGAPIIHMIKWLRLLREGSYVEPAMPDGTPRSLNRHGRRKRKYRIYGDVIHSLDSLSETLRINKRKQAEYERNREEWIAGVSHDLKTPLSSIKGYAHMLEAETYEWAADEVRSFAKVILDKSTYMEGLINDLTLTYQARSGSGAPSLEEVDLNTYIAEAVRESSFHPQYRKKRIRFVPWNRAVIYSVYKPWFQRIVDNLVANALMHNREGTILTISVSAAAGGGVTVAFADDGEGMDEQTASRLFERYYRGLDTESRAEGTGLGMAVTKALTEGLGGTIEVETAQGSGTVIRLKWDSSDQLKP
ncbi:ATP-binding response regulator [Paenibacillus nasutitermitis]|uniref:histidine kinase n=1 Tax=Paenibacillus nasutitermitis TaxID=1652958 RepID=A0A916YQ86_9BACL|nr:HAMP domain-containing sensor histidine kinase [Paenibacillus nasutitermitis]GGD56169.1 two-component sensor histidine kinase [Paenibacillus nasutitermitis]